MYMWFSCLELNLVIRSKQQSACWTYAYANGYRHKYVGDIGFVALQ